MPPVAEYVLCGVIIALALAWLIFKNYRHHLTTALIAAMAIYATAGMYKYTFADITRSHATQNLSDAKELSFQLMITMAELLESKAKTPSGKQHLQERTDASEKALEEDLAHVKSPSVETLLHRIVLKHSLKQDSAEQLDSLRQSKSADGPPLADAIAYAFGTGQISASQAETILTTNMHSSWYRDQILEALYTKSQQNEKFAHLKDDEAKKNLALAIKFVFVCVSYVLMYLAGIVVLTVLLVKAWRQRRLKQAPDNLSGSGTIEKQAQYSDRYIATLMLAYLTVRITLGIVMRDTGMDFYAARDHLFVVTLLLICLFTLVHGWPLACAYFTIIKPQNISFSDAIRLHLGTPSIRPLRMIVNGFLTYFAIIPVVSVTVVIAMFMRQQPSSNPILGLETAAAQSGDLGAIISLLFLTSILGPLIEELLIRGFLYGALRQRYSVNVCAFATGIYFAALHFDANTFYSLMAIGVCLAYATERTKSIVPGYIAHCLWNGGVFTCIMLLRNY